MKHSTPAPVQQRDRGPPGGATLTHTQRGGLNSSADSLDFGEDDVDVGAGDVLAIDDLAVFAQFGPVLPVKLLPRGLCVAVDSKLLKRRQELLYVRILCHDGKISETRRGRGKTQLMIRSATQWNLI